MQDLARRHLADGRGQRDAGMGDRDVGIVDAGYETDDGEPVAGCWPEADDIGRQFQPGLRQQFRLHLKEWLQLPLDEITKSMVVSKHRAMAKAPSSANHTLKYFRTVWNHARRVHDLPECPTMAIEWYEEKPSAALPPS